MQGREIEQVVPLRTKPEELSPTSRESPSLPVGDVGVLSRRAVLAGGGLLSGAYGAGLWRPAALALYVAHGIQQPFLPHTLVSHQASFSQVCTSVSRLSGQVGVY